MEPQSGHTALPQAPQKVKGTAPSIKVKSSGCSSCVAPPEDVMLRILTQPDDERESF